MASRYLRTSRHPPTVNERLAVAEAAPAGQNGSSLKVASGGSGVLAKKRTLKLSSTAAAPRMCRRRLEGRPFHRFRTRFSNSQGRPRWP